MGFIHQNIGNIEIEERSESFIIHPNYGYNKDGSEFSNELGSFGELWRESIHPEFINEDLDDLISALLDFRERKNHV